MLVCLFAYIFQDPAPLVRAVRPVHDAVGAKIGRPLVCVVDCCPLRDAAHDDARNDCVPGHGQRLFNGRDDEDQEVREQMGADQHAREERRQRSVQQSRQGIIGKDLQTEWCAGAGVGICHVLLC